MTTNNYTQAIHYDTVTGLPIIRTLVEEIRLAEKHGHPVYWPWYAAPFDGPENNRFDRWHIYRHDTGEVFTDRDYTTTQVKGEIIRLNAEYWDAQ
jgi:hypothetical protein